MLWLYWIDLIVNLIDFQFVEFCSVLSTVFVKMCKRDTADALALSLLDWIEVIVNLIWFPINSSNFVQFSLQYWTLLTRRKKGSVSNNLFVVDIMIFTLFTRSLSSLYTIIVHRSRVDSLTQTNLFILLCVCVCACKVINDQSSMRLWFLFWAVLDRCYRSCKYFVLTSTALTSWLLVNFFGGFCTSIIKFIQN